MLHAFRCFRRVPNPQKRDQQSKTELKFYIRRTAFLLFGPINSSTGRTVRHRSRIARPRNI